MNVQSFLNYLPVLDILLGVIILTAGLHAGRIGLDRWVIPFIRKFAGNENNTVNPMKHSA